MNIILKNQIWTIDNFLSKEECTKFISDINNKERVRPFTISGKFKNDRFIDDKLANSFYNKVKKEIDKPILRANNLVMTGKYKPGDIFGLHTDTGLYFDLSKGEKSNYTLLIYLNDNFKGGRTIFYDNCFQKIVEIKPKKGMALLFDINLWHKAEEIYEGEKYWIGCEIISKMYM